ncbi:DUF177 domain-containing protein [Candidatus Parcubacteria bacterium]|nr:DUF177 domain-containing protein [Candidatus Parcubacteria bacterium]
MHINIKDILDRETGERAEFAIEGERPDLPDVELAEDLGGSATITKLDDVLLVEGELATQLKLECHRCLSSFTHPARIQLGGRFSFNPNAEAEGDEWPISKRFEIDLAPLVRQELLLALPIQLLCREACLGLCIDCGQPQEAEHEH